MNRHDMLIAKPNVSKEEYEALLKKTETEELTPKERCEVLAYMTYQSMLIMRKEKL